MDLKLERLTLFCKNAEEGIPFSPRLSFFHGEMSTGKSTIVEMINFCFGGALSRTPAVTSEVVGVQLILVAGKTEILIERSVHSGGRVDVTWTSEEGRYLTTLPLVAEQTAIVGEDIFNFSDFMLRKLGIPLLKVRRSKADADSDMQRIGFRDFYKFVYLDQDELDSSFFLLETPIRQEKSKDVLRYVLGFHSDELITLEIRLSEVRQQQRVMRETAKQIDNFLGRYGFNSEKQISDEIDSLDAQAAKLDAELKKLTPSSVPSSYLSDDQQEQLAKLTSAISAKQVALSDVEEQLRDQESLTSELLSMKFKVARSTLASRVLEGAEFHLCPACGSHLAPPLTPDTCELCHADLTHMQKPQELDAAVVERDLSERVEDLERSAKRLRRARDRHQTDLITLMETRGDIQLRVDMAKSSMESQYMQRIRALESELGRVSERKRLLNRVIAMPSEIEARRKEADQMSQQIADIERQIDREREKFEAGRSNLAQLEKNFLKTLQAIHFPGITAKDTIWINTKTWMPYILPGGNEDRAWTFSDAGSGGKKVLFKISFALALHQTAAELDLPLPKLLIIDSTMKNITPDINPDIVKHFYKELYRLLASELGDWQFVLVDQTYFPADDALGIQLIHRLMKKDDPEYPPLISYYKGH